MSTLFRAATRALHLLEPERAHRTAILALKAGLGPRPGPFSTPRLRVRLAGLDLPNPVGLAAGFDKDCEVTAALGRTGFGFVECGAITPRPQPGNPRPRLFRLTPDRAVINRFGFNNAGMQAAARRLAAAERPVPTGINLGANKDSADRPGDYAQVLASCGPHVDFATINVSSPNTEGLRDLQGARALAALIGGVLRVRDDLPRPIPIFVKIAPDLDHDALSATCDAVQAAGADGIIATNTTLTRTGLKSASSGEKGGLSGAPLFDLSTRVLAHLARITAGELPLIGVGGVGSAEQAYAKIRAGASAVQLYTALVYEGLTLADDIARGLDRLLARDGHDTLAQAVGTDKEEYP